MRTKTSKQILGPLAEAVSALIVIIAEAEIHSKPTPDLSKLAQAVVTQIQNLLNIAKQITENPSADKELQQSMPSSCEIVSRASESLITATAELAKNPISSSGRSMLLEAVKGILQGTTGILDAFDDFEVRKILNSSSNVRESCATLKTLGSNADEFINETARLAQLIVGLAQLATKRISELVSDLLQLQLQNTIDILVKVSPLVVNASKVFLSKPDDASHRAVLVGFLDRIDEATKKIDYVVLCRSEAEIAETGLFKNLLNKRRNMGQELVNLSEQENFPVEPTSKFIDLSNEAIRKAINLLECNTNQTTRAKTGAILEELNEMLGELRNKPSNPREIHDAKQALLGVQHNFQRLEAHIPVTLAAEFVSSIGTLSDQPNEYSTISRLTSNINNPKEFQRALGGFNQEHKRLDEIVNSMLENLDPGMGEFYEKAILQKSAVKGLASLVESSAVVASSHPEDPVYKVNLDSSIKTFVDSCRELSEHILSHENCFGSAALIEGTKKAYENNSMELLTSLKNQDINHAQDTLALANICADGLVNIARKQMELTGDVEYKRELEGKIQSVIMSKPSLGAAVQSIAASSNPPTEQELEAISKAVASVSQNLEALGATINRHKGNVPNLESKFERLAWIPPAKDEVLEGYRRRESALLGLEKLLLSTIEQDEVGRLAAGVQNISATGQKSENVFDMESAQQHFKNTLQDKVDLGELKHLQIASFFVLADNLYDLGNAKDTTTTSGLLLNAINNKQNLANALVSFDSQSKKLNSLLNFSINFVPESQKPRVLDLTQQLHVLGKTASEKSKLVSLNNTENSKKDAETALLAFSDFAKSARPALFQRNVFLIHDIVSAAKFRLDVHSQGILALVKTLDKRSKLEVAKALDTMEFIKEVYEQEKTQTKDDTYQAVVAKQISNIESMLPRISKELYDVVGQEKVNYRHYDICHSSCDEMKEAIQDFASIVTSHLENITNTFILTEEEQIRLATQLNQDETLKALTKSVNEIVVSNEQKPELLSEQEAELDPIKAAGQELLVEASFWSNDNQIIQLAIVISQRFLELSAYHNKIALAKHDAASKKAFIQTAQAIVQETALFVKSIQPIVEDCVDKRLKASITSTLARISTLSQQLKVICAVKASAPFDKDRGQQLIFCAQNLVNSIKTAIREAISCTLRRKTQGLKFKRVVYANQLLAACIDLNRR